MSVKLSEVIKVIEKFAPTKLKESYDNVGLMVGDMDADITSVLVSLDSTLEVIEEAKEKNCELILSHHPLLFRKPNSITEETLLGKKIRMAVKNNINIYASHTNLDVVEDGINDLIVRLLGFNKGIVMEKSCVIPDNEKVGIGRLIDLKDPILLEDLCKKVKNDLGLSYLRYSGESNWQVNKIAIINGSGQDYFNLAKKLGANCIITGDTTYHYVSDFYEEGIPVIDAGHFGTEWPAVKIFAKHFKKLLQVENIDIEVKVSERNFDPYKIMA
ncbi:MAG: Nif3-like dinuclear metal center hexameric protein [Clostridiales bacterium]|uniref:Nif3-like dinuclear metal center hexameric protein n=1 Tax=Clostridium sp. N3C TaxID=1776758 RepID=UPI00092E07E7|nr:Nif3-like dinuclear metal center hexameric protein [Clostridium sp. N3C]NLZ49940.1 Nif3-like dinuclear metal center hexameric protein [Clostridiales bacterium]SCN21822.1 metal-binding protein [Clostridium sp. N3C]